VGEDGACEGRHSAVGVEGAACDPQASWASTGVMASSLVNTQAPVPEVAIHGRAACRWVGSGSTRLQLSRTVMGDIAVAADLGVVVVVVDVDVVVVAAAVADDHSRCWVDYSLMNRGHWA